MRAVLYGLLGLVAGGALGLLLAFLVAWLWTVAGLPLPNEAKAALALMVRLAIVLIPLGALAGAVWFIRRDRAGKRTILILPIVVGALVCAYVLLLLTDF